VCDRAQGSVHAVRTQCAAVVFLVVYVSEHGSVCL
jgi:hypothetical protein